MADKNSYPMMSSTAWWAIRRKFKQAIPSVVNDSYLSTVLNMKTDSVRNNVIPYLKAIGIINQDGKPTSRATAWRDDVSYKKVCEEIIKEIYPQELIDIAPDSSIDRDVLMRWFSQSGIGLSAAAKCVAFYTLLLDGNAQNGEVKNEKQKKGNRVSTSSKKKPASEKEEEPTDNVKLETQMHPKTATMNKCASSAMPALNINLQIHISSDASAEQIERIFSSMAKHLYKNQE